MPDLKVKSWVGNPLNLVSFIMFFRMQQWPRYYSTLCLIGHESKENSDIHYPLLLDKPSKPTLLIFAGDSGILDGLLDDMWAAEVPSNHKSSNEVHKHRCKVITDPSNMAWNQTCGSSQEDTTEETYLERCAYEDIITMAWCLDQYQSFLSPI